MMATSLPVVMMLFLSASVSFAFILQPSSLHQQHRAHSRAPAKPVPARGSALEVSSLMPSGGCSSRGRARSPVLCSTVEVVDVVADDGDASSSTVVDEFDVKTNLLKKIDLTSSRRVRTEVNELMLQLEPMNPTEMPARSATLNGVWEFLYTGGVSPGTLAVQVLSRVAKSFSAVVDLKGITLTIKRDQPRVEAAVKASVLGTEAQVKVRTRLEQKSDMRLQEVYEEAEVAGVTIPIPARIQPRRTLYITYLDDDIMIARDDSGAPDLLIRKQKDFRFNTGTPSTSEDDDSSPGSG
ncbi:unnamed protein product [Pylaiella littoralis]